MTYTDWTVYRLDYRTVLLQSGCAGSLVVRANGRMLRQAELRHQIRAAQSDAGTPLLRMLANIREGKKS